MTTMIFGQLRGGVGRAKPVYRRVHTTTTTRSVQQAAAWPRAFNVGPPSNPEKEPNAEEELLPLLSKAAPDPLEKAANDLKTWNLVAGLVHLVVLGLLPLILQLSGVFSADFEFAVTGIVSSNTSIPEQMGMVPFWCPERVAKLFNATKQPGDAYPQIDGENSQCLSTHQYDYMMTHQPMCNDDHEQCTRRDLLTYRNWVCPRDKTTSDAGYEKRCDTTGRGGGMMDSRSTYFRIRLFYWLITFPFLTGFFHLLCCFRHDNYKKNLLENLRQPIRWIEYSITSSIMQVGCANLCGVTDAWSLLNQFALSISTNMFGLAIDLVPSIRDKWTMFLAGCVGFVTSWVQLLVHFSIAFLPVLANDDYRNLLWFVPVVVSSLFVSYLTFPGVTIWVIWNMQQVQQTDQTTDSDRLRQQKAHIMVRGERGYIILSFVAKFVLIAIVASAAISRPSEE